MIKQMPRRELRWSFDFPLAPTQVWSALSNTDRANRAMGFPSVAYSEQPGERGRSERMARFRWLGINVIWKESPYEWVEGKYFSVERLYLTGPISGMELDWRLEPLPTGGSRLFQRISYEGRGPLSQRIADFQIGFLIRRKFLRLYKDLARAFSQASPEAIGAPLSFPPLAEDLFQPNALTIDRIQEGLRESGIPEDVQEKFRDLLFKSQLPDLVRIRPFVLAKRWKLSNEETLSHFLKATRAGLFDLSWDLICPNCRGAKLRAGKLANLKNQAHCGQCNIRFEAEFDRSVEVSFTVNSRIRTVSSVEFCAGSPQKTPHFLVQLRIKAGERRSIHLDLPSGYYRFRSLHSRQRYSFNIENAPQHPDRARLTFEPEREGSAVALLRSGNLEFEFWNQKSEEIVVTLERDRLFEDSCTAAFVTTLQEFSDLFSSEVLRAGEEIRVSAVTILFSDLKGSTRLYQRVGDAKAYALVSQHLQFLTEQIRNHHGTVVKSIGDAIMASFLKPEAALRAALEIQEEMTGASPVLETGERLEVKIGIHTGPCFVVNGNGRLDYFGSTVNLAARVQEKCEGSQILLTQEMMNDAGVRDLLTSSRLQSVQATHTAKGFEGDFKLYFVSATRARRSVSG